MAIVAAPDYLARHGTPETPADLEQHKGIGWTFPRLVEGWPFRIGDAREAVSAAGGARQRRRGARLLALGGVGLARLSLFHVRPDIEAGRLVPVLEEFNPRDCEESTPSISARAGRCRPACARWSTS